MTMNARGDKWGGQRESIWCTERLGLWGSVGDKVCVKAVGRGKR